MNKFKISLAILILIIFILGCSLTTRPAAQEGPPFEVWTATVQIEAATPEATFEPTIQAPAYEKAQISSYLSQWLTYDPTAWTAAKWLDGSNQSGEEVQVLVHRVHSGCSLHDNLGHGVPDTWSFTRFSRELGGVVFQIDQFTDTTTGNPVLVIYQYPPGDSESNPRRIELEPGASPYDCIAAADAVIALSVGDITQ
jgi:hypothetical protein